MTSASAPVSASAAELGALAVELARGAAAVVAVHAADALDVSAKSSASDLVTDIDRLAERWLVDSVLARRPHDAILGEEGGERPGTSGVRWLLDPIDGTVNFVLGLPQFAVSVAAEVSGEVLAAAVANPVSGELFRATRGGGAYLGDVRLGGPRDVPLERAVVGTGFGYDVGLRARQGRVVADLLARVADVRRLGAAALDLCFVAAGRLDAYFEVGLHPWDCAAGALVATEAGCVVTGLRGRAPGATCLAVAGPGLAADFAALLEELDADGVSS